MAKMTVEEFLKRLRLALNSKTLYVLGGWGAPLTDENKTRFISKNDYNRKRRDMIMAASSDTFAFDCVNVGKAILWGWDADTKKKNGGAIYRTNGCPDSSADGMFKNYCYDKTADFSRIEIGEVLWMSGHFGYYIGRGLAIECTPKWKNGVQITAVGNIGKVDGYPTRVWSKHGKWKRLDYTKKELVPIYRLYNRNKNGMHHFTPSKGERDALEKLGWKYEGIAWDAPAEGAPVYSMYDPITGDHYLTTDTAKCTQLTKEGRKNEGIKFFSDGDVQIWQLHNKTTGEHFYTANKGEYDALILRGWIGDGKAFKAMKGE